MRESIDKKIKTLEFIREHLLRAIIELNVSDSEYPQKREAIYEELFKIQGQCIVCKKMGELGKDFWELWEKSSADKIFDSENLTQFLEKGIQLFGNLKLHFKFEGETDSADTSWPVYQAVKNLLIADQLNNAVYTVLSERKRRRTFLPFSEEDDEDVEKMFIPLLIVKSLVVSEQEEAACSVVEFLITHPLKYEDDED